MIDQSVPVSVYQYTSIPHPFIIIISVFSKLSMLSFEYELPLMNIINLIMTSELYDLSNLEDHFKRLVADKKKSAVEALDFVLELNTQIKIDEILIREGFEIFPNKQELQKQKKYEIYEAFFKNIIENLDSIEENYLKQSNDKKKIEEVSEQNQNEYNYLLNKNSISKFIRDEAAHYQDVIEKYLESTGQQDQKGIKTKKMHLFFIDLFNNNYTSVIKDHLTYLKRPEEVAVHIGNTLINYGQQAKEMTFEQAQMEFSINEEEILDFLTFWLKQESGSSLFILYARTTRRLDQQSKILFNTSNVQVKKHPSRMTRDEIKFMEQQQEKAGIVAQEPLQKSQIFQNGKKQQLKQEQSKNNALSLLRSKQYEAVSEERKPPKRQEISEKQLKKLFSFGCKRRYKVHKNNTFDSLQFQLTNMNLQKFMFFCQFFELPQIVSRQLLIQFFKLFALNGRSIDFTRFEQIMSKIIEADPRVVTNLLNKLQFEIKSQQHELKSSKRDEGKLSKYKFKLRPINGKDISSMQRELAFKKLEKTVEREQKNEKALIKRERIQQPKQTRNNYRSISHLGNSNKMQISHVEPVKEAPFNPERLITFERDNDDLWDAYEAKIWKKEGKAVHNTLEQILSKRINRGTSIINKMNSERTLLYE